MPRNRAAGDVGVGGQRFVEMVGVGQVDVRDDPTHHPTIGRFRSGRDELGLADRSQVLGPVGAVARVALDEHRVDDVVTGREVGLELAPGRTAALRPAARGGGGGR